MDNKTNIYVDMDGVQAVYGFGDSVEDMTKPGYFRNRGAYKNMISTIKNLARDPKYNVTVLSAVFRDGHSIEDKKYWLKLQGLGHVNTCFVPCGENKADYVPENEANILIDDFSRNLFAWEACGKNFLGIKFFNEKNGSKGSWLAHKGSFVNLNMTPEEISRVLRRAAQSLRMA